MGKTVLCCLGFFLGESFFGPMHRALAIYAFIEFIFITVVIRTMEHVLRHVYAFWVLKCLRVSKRREYFYSSIWSHLLLFLYIFYCNQRESSEY